MLLAARLLTVIGVLLFVGCASEPTYEIDYDQGYDFSRISNYRWYDDVVKSQVAQYRHYNASDKRVRDFVGVEMRRHGIVEATGTQADVWLNYSLSKRQTVRETGNDSGLYGGAGVGTYGSAVSIGYSTGPTVRVYQDGTAILDIIDARTQKIVWRGVAEGRLKNDRDSSDKRKAAAVISRELLATFPPQ